MPPGGSETRRLSAPRRLVVGAALTAAPTSGLRGVAQPCQERVDALVQRIGLPAELAGCRRYVLGECTRLVSGLAGAGDVRRDFAGAGGRLLHAAGDLARRRVLFLDRRGDRGGDAADLADRVADAADRGDAIAG